MQEKTNSIAVVGKQKIIAFIFTISLSFSACSQNLQIGAYYYGGWSSDKTGAITEKLITQYPEREPIWGWRDDDVRIMERQIELASQNGIDFFAFCWYWADDMGEFNEMKVRTRDLHKSIDLFMKARNKYKMKFCLLIANHKGARIQGEENWVKAVDFFSENYFHDPQYLQIESKPVIMIFLPHEAKDHLSAMRQEANKKGFEGLYIMPCAHHHPGFDALTWYNTMDNNGILEAKDYSDLSSWVGKKWGKASDTIDVVPLCSAGWDRRPWEKEESTVYYINRKPSVFREHLYNAVDYVYSRKPKHPMIMIYAWNEFGEGGYIAPTKGDKRGRFLKQVKKAKKYSIKKQLRK